MPPPNPVSTIKIYYIRVDNKRRIFQETSPGRIKLDANDDVEDMVHQVRERMPSLKALDYDKIKVYKLKTPLKFLPYQTSGAVRRSTRHSAEGKDDEIKAFEAFKYQIATIGIDNPLLYPVRTASLASDYFETCGEYITAVIYHPKLPEDCEKQLSDAPKSFLQ